MKQMIRNLNTGPDFSGRQVDIVGRTHFSGRRGVVKGWHPPAMLKTETRKRDYNVNTLAKAAQTGKDVWNKTVFTVVLEGHLNQWAEIEAEFLADHEWVK